MQTPTLVSFLLHHVGGNVGFLSALVREEMYKCDALFGFNPQRRELGAPQHNGKERPECTK